ncbi:gluconate 2-dehydrogenase subunit 3 family protein [Nocardioides agariphilus]|uniref:Gluconate 2-dehydrogenase subunit 3 family protein n=1 Tax=Nocardioides agariphilus TaxID=433664 RepID=A0A930VEU6_9ACTN|nr:gluconate 2-dehydrogenase subunit 3 family protein [Nocardioides agariphilus]MBF4766204.1 gluconate 2-dehydrogenase subunit 3 family protein [Nocardioides agariphilus]
MVNDRESIFLTFQALRPDEAELFLGVIETVLPHAQPQLDLPRIATALVIDAQMVAGLDLRALVLDGLREVDQSCRRAHGAGFTSVPPEQRVEALRAVEDTPFFQTLIHIVKADFYNRHIVWRVLGYPDLDREDGYLDHGFDRLPLVGAGTAEMTGEASRG